MLWTWTPAAISPGFVPDLDSRERIDELLAQFYGRALDDELLGPVFAGAGLDLATHLPRIGGFWERSLLGTGSYAGRPMQIHRHLMREFGLTEQHFDRWLQLWHTTLAELFKGPGADQAAQYAVRMAGAMLRQGPGENELPLA
jgi:hemoglobin